MKQISLVIFLWMLSIPLQAQKQEERSFSNFTVVDIRGDFEIIFEKGDKNQIKLTSTNIPLDQVSTSQKGATLKIKRKLSLGEAFEDSGVKLHIIHNNELAILVIDGSSEVIVKDTINVNEAYLEMSGSGSFRATIQSKRLKLDSSGGTEWKLSGEVSTLMIKATGSSNVDALALSSDVAEVNAIGSADIKVKVNEDLNAKITGLGNIYYTGEPSSVRSKVTGTGKVKKYKGDE